MWEIEGYEKQTNVEGVITAYKIYVSKDNKGNNCEGRKCRSFWYKVENISYIPEVGERVFVETELFGKYEVVTDIIVV